jgi:hypothetical protein
LQEKTRHLNPSVKEGMMRITTWIAASLARLRSLFSKKESIMSDQTVINPTSTKTSSPAEDFANEVATPVTAPPAVTAAPEAAPAAPEAAPAVVAEAAPTATPEAAAAATPEAAPNVTSEAISPAPAEAAPPAAPEAVTPAPAEVAPPSVPEVAAPASADAPPAAAAAESHDASQAFSEGVKDFVQAFSFVEQGVIKLGDAAKDELIELARKYL